MKIYIVLSLVLLLTACGYTTTPDPSGSTKEIDTSINTEIAADKTFSGRVLNQNKTQGEVDNPNDGVLHAQAHTSFPTTSGFLYNDPTSKNIVNNTDGPVSDEYVSNSGIFLSIPIRRYVGPTDSDGRLLNADELVKKGIVSRYATLVMPTYDIDANTRPQVDCDSDGQLDDAREEVDEVYFNDKKLGQFTGSNNVWSQFIKDKIDIKDLKFPSKPGETAINMIEVKVDAANKDLVTSSGSVGCAIWYTSVDWAQLSFEAMSPIVLVHGINNTGDTWLQSKHYDGFVKLLQQEGYPVLLNDQGQPPTINHPAISRSMMDTYPSIQNSAAQLLTQINTMAEKYGVESVHVIGHSKGGMDARGLLRYYHLQDGDLKTDTGGIKLSSTVKVGQMSGSPVTQHLSVESYTSINTPHGGSPLADVGYLTLKYGYYFPNKLFIKLAGMSNPADPSERYSFTHPPAYTKALTVERAWQDNYSTYNQVHKNLKNKFFIGTDFASKPGTPLGYKQLQYITGRDIQISIPFQPDILIKSGTNPNLRSDGIVPIWSSGDDQEAIFDPVSYRGPRLTGALEINTAPADHSTIADQPSTLASILNSAQNPNGLNWRLR